MTTTCANANAPRSERFVWLFGDSISRGWALRDFEDENLDPNHPLYELRSISSTANWALDLNGRPERFCYGGNLDPADINVRAQGGYIQPQDLVVLEDAGDYALGAGAYYTHMWNARVAAASAAETVMMSMFDYCATASPACPTTFQYDYVGPGGSLNSATHRAATVTANPVSGTALPYPTQFIDMNWVMDSMRNNNLYVGEPDPIHPDGIHPNVWGQMRMTQHILHAAGLGGHLGVTAPIEQLCADNLSLLQYGGTLSEERARTYVQDMLG